MKNNIKLDLQQWANIFRNIAENNEEVEILWLDGSDEFVLACGTELFEDGFKSEKEAEARLEQLENLIL